MVGDREVMGGHQGACGLGLPARDNGLVPPWIPRADESAENPPHAAVDCDEPTACSVLSRWVRYRVGDDQPAGGRRAFVDHRDGRLDVGLGEVVQDTLPDHVVGVFVSCPAAASADPSGSRLKSTETWVSDFATGRRPLMPVALVLLRRGVVHLVHVDFGQLWQPIGARVSPGAEDDQLRIRFGANGLIYRCGTADSVRGD